MSPISLLAALAAPGYQRRPHGPHGRREGSDAGADQRPLPPPGPLSASILVLSAASYVCPNRSSTPAMTGFSVLATAPESDASLTTRVLR